MHQHEKIDYVEFPAEDLDAVKKFFAAVFDWSFTDYGADYAAFSNAGLDGGFYRDSRHSSAAEHACALIVFYSADLEATQQKIEAAGGTIVQAVFSFPGGRRFHFADPSGNEYAVWTDVE